MSAFEKVVNAIADTIKMNDRIVGLTDKVKELAGEVQNINNRVVRLETFIEIAEKQRVISKRRG